jgi:tetratricopeptide (TPR) repeat protein
MEMERLLPGKYFIQFYLGNCHLEQNDPKTALTYFSRALELSPANQDLPSIYSYMGVCHKELGDYEKALAVLAKGEAVDPERTDIHNLMGFCHFMRKEHEAAIQRFEKVIAAGSQFGHRLCQHRVQLPGHGKKSRCGALLPSGTGTGPIHRFCPGQPRTAHRRKHEPVCPESAPSS